jgi:uncharacterized delta-60 repeat protein
LAARASRFIVLAVVTLFLTTQPALGAAGDLDTSFDGDGVVLTDFPPKFEGAAAVAVQADGAIVAAGRSVRGGDSRFAVARYLADGSPDLSFGGDGRVVTNITLKTDFATALAIQTDGAIVAVGRAGGGYGRFAAVRYLPNGALDPSFGGDGIVTTNFTRRNDYASAVAIQEADGTIIVAGRARQRTVADSSAHDAAFGLVRYLPDGGLDTSFSGDGTIFANLTSGEDYAFDMAIQSDGRIVVVGRAGGSRGRFGVARYESDGALDVSFGGDGKVFTNLSASDDYARSVALQQDGRIVAAGTAAYRYGSRFALTRYESDGALDPTFSGDGKGTTRFAEYFDGWWFDEATGVEIQNGGKIVVAGTSFRSVLLGMCCDTFAAIARFTSGGTLDATFSGDGKVVEDVGPSHSAAGLALQADGRIVTAGDAFGDPSVATYFVVERYLAA